LHLDLACGNVAYGRFLPAVEMTFDGVVRKTKKPFDIQNKVPIFAVLKNKVKE